MKTSTVAWIVILIIIVLGGWWWFSQSGQNAPSTNTNPVTNNSVSLGSNSTSTIGTYLTGSNGMALYTYDNDSTGSTTCYAQCAQNWPPYVVAPNTKVTPPSGASGQVSTIQRSDGGQQVTYNGMPLYFYAKDQATGDVTGDGVGSVWHVAKP